MVKYKLFRVVHPSRKVPGLNCEVQDLEQEVPDLRSGGTPPPI